jgi:hypothetical protein
MKAKARADNRPAITLPADARAALAKAPAAKARWDSLSYTHRKEFAESIAEAKKPETRERRIAKMIEKLQSDRPTLSNTISTKPAVTKLGITPGQQVLVLDADAAARAIWKALPRGATLIDRASAGCGDVVVLYAPTAAALARRLPVAIRATKGGGVLWVAYLKQTSGRATTLTRDVGWEPTTQARLQWVTMIALDDNWAAAKFRIPA